MPSAMTWAKAAARPARAASGQLGGQDPQIRGTAIVGAFLEGVVAPLAARPVDAARRDEVGHEIAASCQNAVTGAGRHPRHRHLTPMSGTRSGTREPSGRHRWARKEPQ